MSAEREREFDAATAEGHAATRELDAAMAARDPERLRLAKGRANRAYADVVRTARDLIYSRNGGR